MINLADAGRAGWIALLRLSARPVLYAARTSPAITLNAYVRGMRSEDLFAAAEQTDIVAIIDVDEFVAKVPFPQPARFDRLQTFAQTFAVEAWRPAPNYTNPVVFKVLLRGGTQ